MKPTFSMAFGVNNFQGLSFVFACLWITISGQLLVPVTSPNASPKPTSSVFPQSSCNYLVSRTNGVCMVTTSAVDRQLNAIKDDNFRARLQYMSQNSVLQTQIAKIQSDDTKMALRVDGLQRDLQSLRSRLANTVTGTGSGTATTPVGPSVIQVQNSLQQQIQGVDSRVTSLTSRYQQDAVSQARTNAAFQQQLTQLLTDNQQLKLNNNRLTQSLQQLTAQVQALATQCAAGCGAATAAPANTPSTTSTTTTTTTAATTQPAPTINPARLAKIEQDILTLGNQMQQTNADLAVLDKLVTQNHTQEIRNAQLELRSHDLRITKNENDVSQVYQALQILNTVTVPNMQGDISTLQRDSQALKTLTTQLQAAQKVLLNDTLFMKLDVAQIQTDLKKTDSTHRKAIEELNQNLIGPLLAAYPQLNQVQANVIAYLNGQQPATVGGSTTPGTPSTTGSIIIPPTLKPPITAPPAATTSPKAGGGIIVPPTLKPVGPG